MKEESKIVEQLTEMLRKSDRHDELFELQGKVLEKHSQLLEKLVEGQLDLIEGHNKLVEGQNDLVRGQNDLVKGQIDLVKGQIRTNSVLEEIKDAIKDIARLDEHVRKLEFAVFKQAS